MVIALAPTSGPAFGVTSAIVGSKVLYVKAITLDALPPGVATATVCEPDVPAGVTAVIDVGDTTVKLAAATPPTVTLVAPVKLVPVIVIEVPPPTGPDTGLTPVMVGAGIVGSM